MSFFNLRPSIAASLVALALVGCATENPGSPQARSTTLSGVVGSGSAQASVTIFDAQGHRSETLTDNQGRYRVALTGMVPPLMLVAQTNGKQYVALSPDSGDGAAIANINALTDRIASDLAQEAKFKGPVGLASAGKAPELASAVFAAKTAELRTSLAPALKQVGIQDVEHFDPLRADMNNLHGIYDILTLVKHNRGYHSASGERGETAIYDSNYREITRSRPLDLNASRAEATVIAAPDTVRVFIAGDSTASIYDPEVAPRMGWGQVFERQVKPGAKIKVVDVAQSGRSSRSFINEGWFDMIAADIRKGDYLLVQFGHNDEKCGNEPPAPPPSRDKIDTEGLCTYPGNNPAIPAEMSFRKTLEKYIALARKVGATPVLITPVTRRAFKNGSINSTTHTYTKGKFPGDYSQTIRDTAQANGVTLVDLDAKSMAFFSKIGEQDSLDYYLAVDPARYPYYATNTGSRSKPDNTHFQERGAEAVAGLVASGIKESLLPLANQLK